MYCGSAGLAQGVLMADTIFVGGGGEGYATAQNLL
jgi:hypothetical protein